MAKQITDLPLKATAAAGDGVLIRDVSASADKRTTVAGLATALAASLPAGSITPAAMLGIDLFGRSASGVVGTPPASGTGQFYMQAGSSLASTNSAGGGSVSFESAFPNGVLTVLLTNGEIDAYRNSIHIIGSTYTTSGFSFRLQTDTTVSTMRVNWLAIGW